MIPPSGSSSAPSASISLQKTHRSHSRPFFFRAGLIAAVCIWGAIAPAVATSLIANGSFENGLVDTNFGFAGYCSYTTSIPNWTCQVNIDGINGNGSLSTPTYNTNQFANNGVVPDGTHVAFLQAYGGAGAILSQNVAGLVNGQSYLLSYYVNARNEGDTPALTVSLGTQTLAGPTAYSPVNSINTFTTAYNYVQVPFTYSSAWGSNLSFSVSTGSGSILLDKVSLDVQPAQALSQSTPIGSPASGSMSYNAGTYTITGLGTGIELSGYNGSDRMYFAYMPVTGDVEIKARVVSFNNTGEGHIGLTMRSGTGTGDQMGATLFIPNHLYNTATNPTLINWCRGPLMDGHPDYYDNLGKGQSDHPGLTPPFWLKLTRVGNNYGGSWSLDGRDWYPLHDVSGGAFFPTGTYNVGVFVSSGSTSGSSTAVVDNVTVTTPAPKYKTSWIGTTSAGVAAGRPANQVYSMWVHPDGTCYAEGSWSEADQPGRLYKDGKVLHSFYDWNGGGFEGGITGNATNLYFYDAHSGGVMRSDFVSNSPTPVTFISNPTGTPPIPTLGVVRGLAASATRLFVSDYTNGLVRIVDTSTNAEISRFSLPRCGPIAYDGTNFWIIQAATHDTNPFSWYVVGTDPTSILCFQPDGTPLPAKTIAWTLPDTCIPTALAYQDVTPAGPSSSDILWVCDNSPHQYIRKYNNLNAATPPTPSGTPFGVDGGAFSGATPGLIKDTAAGTDRRFYGPTGVGTDSQGNIYVACNGASHFVTDVRKFDPAGTLQWRINGLVFVQVGDFDPKAGDDGANIYLPEKHLTMNYANTAPGSEWAYKSFTRDLTKNDYEARNGGNPMGINFCAMKLARLGSSANLYMYTGGQGVTGTMCLYYFNGEIAVPYGAYIADGAGNRLWIDANNNKIHDAGEETLPPASFLAGEFQSFDVDGLGDVWMMIKGSSSGIRRLVNQGVAPLGGVTGQPSVPTYNLSAAGMIDYKLPAPLVSGYNVSFDSTTDTMYIIGKTSTGVWKLVRCDKWKANPESQLNPTATWAVTLPSEPDLSILYPLPALDQYMGMDLAVDKLFVAEQYGPAHVYDTTTGNLELTFSPGPEISGTMGWVDMSMGINAYKRSTGEYVVVQDNTGFNSCDLLYRWTPSSDTAVTASSSGLTATVVGGKIVLSWNGPTGMVTSYNLYRGTSAGGETLYQSGITSPTFTDLNVTPGTTYYYKVTAVNAAGESVKSNEASASPLTSQAEFVTTDTTTQGNWKTVYGAQGYEVCNDTIHFPGPGYTVATSTTPTVTRTVDWQNPTTDVRGLQKANDITRLAAYRTPEYTANPMSWNINFTDGKWHQVALYMLDWTSTRPSTVVRVLDAATDAVLDSRQMGNYSQGKYVVWNVTGNVKIQVTEPNFPDWTVASGIFIDPVKVPIPAIGWWKMDDTGTSTTVTDSSGAGHYGTRSGGSWNASGKINGCINIPGGTANVTLPNALITGKNPVTLSAWIKTSSTTGAVIAGYQNAASSPTTFVPVLYVGTDGKVHGTYNTGVVSTLTSAASVNDNNWHHVALVGNGNVQTLYVDGIVADCRVGAILTTALNYNYLGYGTVTGWPALTGTTNNFNGYLDDVRLDNKALTSGQIYSLFNP